MKRHKIITSCAAVAAALSVSAVGVSAAAVSSDAAKPSPAASSSAASTPAASQPAQNATASMYGSSTGKVKDINKNSGSTNISLVLSDNSGGDSAILRVKPSTCYVTKDGVTTAANIKTGDEVTGYYDISTDKPMIMIYPPTYDADIIVAKNAADSVKVDKFDKELLSSDKQLKLNVSPDAVILSESGQKYAGDIKDKRLAVLYSIMTMSIPAQTNPERIIVLSDSEAAPSSSPAATTSSPSPSGSPTATTSIPIVVNNEKTNAPAPFFNGQDVVMVPLRAIAEKLGYEAVWDGENKTVRLGNLTTLTIGQDSYFAYRMAPMQLGAAPVIHNGLTYVPLRFFREIVGAKTAIFFEGQVVIDMNVSHGE